MNSLFVPLLITLLVIIILACYITQGTSMENFTSPSKNEINIFSLKEHKKKFLDSVANLNKQIKHLKEYYGNEENEESSDL